MKLKTKVLLIIFAIITSLIIPSIVNAVEVQKPTLDKNSSIREGDFVTVTVVYPNKTGIYFNIKFDTAAFEINSVKAYNAENTEVRIAGNSRFQQVQGKENEGVPTYESNATYGTYKISAPIASDSTDINKVEVKLEAKRDITKDSNIIISNITSNILLFNNNQGSKAYRLPIQALVVEPEPTDPEPTNPEPTDPEPTDPEPTDPEPTDPEPTDPEPTDPEPTDPEPTDPEPTDPEPADPEPTDKPAKDETPKTGLVNISLIGTVAIIISLAGIAAIIKYRK